MRLFIVILTAFFCGLAASVDSNSKESKDGTMFIDSLVDVTTIKPNKNVNSKDSESSGDDEDGSGDVQGDSSGSGSGAVTPTVSRTVAPKTKEENVVVRKVVTVKNVPTTVLTASAGPEPTTSISEATETTTEIIKKTEETTVVPVDTTTPTTEDTFAGGVGNGDGGEGGNVAARKQERQGLQILTKEVIAAVIVGGICAIILIAFLVYRLRKRDEGSYVLTDSAYKDTNKLRGDPGKEAFV